VKPILGKEAIMAVTVYPTGTTIYTPTKCWNGYTIFQASMFNGDEVGAVLVDMNGNVVNQWKGFDGIPNKMLPGGYVMGNTGTRNQKYGFQDQLDLAQVDWDGNVVWKFSRYQRIKDPYQKPVWMARQHHDFQREGNPVGYYVPGMDPLADRGNTLILSHKDVRKPEISGKPLLDDTIIEVTWEGKIVWEWICSDHFAELGFGEEAKNIIARNPYLRNATSSSGDWMHLNSMSTLGPNRWFDSGDQRFHPDNIIWDSRNANIIAIIDKKTGTIVWRLGPDYSTTDNLKKMGWIIGQHHAHMIPKGLPGEGNILVFDNGGQAGYGSPNPGSSTGVGNALRDHSRVLEFDPVTLDMVWTTSPAGSGPGPSGLRGLRLYSSYISSAQRLPNGNTMITEGAGGRIIEVTPSFEIVWEYISPYFSRRMGNNAVYRAYRLPYQWVPQVASPKEKAVPRVDNSKFRVPGSLLRRRGKLTRIRRK
jgi:hypothetical protein